jgi:hypothetical protein
MNWVAKGTVKDGQGYRNTRLVRGGIEVEISYSPTEVRVIKPNHPTPFQDFIALERWLATHDESTAVDKESNSFYRQVEKQIQLRGYAQEMLEVQGTDEEYCKILFKSWLAAEQANENPKVVAALALNSLEYYGKSRDIALSCLRRLESGWNAAIANPQIAAQLKENTLHKQKLEEITDSYQAALDRAEGGVLKFLNESQVYGGYGNSDLLVKLYAWILVYLTAYKAWKDSGMNIHQMCWNTFGRRVENEMLTIKHDGHTDSAVITSPDGSKVLTHFSSDYRKQMDELASIFDAGGVDAVVRELLKDSKIAPQVESDYVAFFRNQSRFVENSLLVKIANLA